MKNVKDYLEEFDKIALRENNEEAIDFLKILLCFFDLKAKLQSSAMNQSKKGQPKKEQPKKTPAKRSSNRRGTAKKS